MGPGSRPRAADDAAARVSGLVRRAGLVAASPPACAAGGAGGHAADRADRRRQDVGGVPAVAGRSRGRASGLAYALCLAPQGAYGGYRAQPRAAGGRPGSADPGRGPDRRHPQRRAAAAAHRSAADPADHAGKPCPDAQLPGSAAYLRERAPSRAGRTARAGREQARRPADAGARATADPVAGADRDRAVGDGRGPGRARRVHGGRTGDPCRSGAGPGYRDARDLSPRAMGGGWRALRGARRAGRDPGGEHDHRLHQHPRAGGAVLPGDLGGERGQPADRTAPRQPRARGAGAGRGGDGGGRIAGRDRDRQP